MALWSRAASIPASAGVALCQLRPGSPQRLAACAGEAASVPHRAARAIAATRTVRIPASRGRRCYALRFSAVALPISPPVQPQLARSAKELPEGEEWCYEPKWDGFRTIVFRDGDDVRLQSRNGRPMNRYFPEVVEQVKSLKAERAVVDGEMIVVVDGIQEFDLLSQRIHPAASRVEKLRNETPAELVAFDLLAEGDDELFELPYVERRKRLAKLVRKPVELTPLTDD